jgi:hypothetical protein
MYINRILSYLGAWEKLIQSYDGSLNELMQAIETLNLEKIKKRGRYSSYNGKTKVDIQIYSPMDIIESLAEKLSARNWETSIKIRQGTAKRLFGKLIYSYKKIDFVKDKVGVSVILDKQQRVVSKLFVDFSFFVRSGKVNIAVIIVPMPSFSEEVGDFLDPSNFDDICDTFIALAPIPLNYPFAIVGVSRQQTAVDVIEMTSELDRLIYEIVGLTFEEMILLNEGQNYDFKEELPRNEKLASEVCAFANLQGGGIILLGVGKHGNIIGLPKGKDLDDRQLRIVNVIHNYCSPVPQFTFYPCDSPDELTKCILIIRVSELSNKPCMTQDKVFIRSGASTRPASPEEIRRLVLGHTAI